MRLCGWIQVNNVGMYTEWAVMVLVGQELNVGMYTDWAVMVLVGQELNEVKWNSKNGD